MIDKDLLRRRFSKQANEYDKYANVQKKMADYLIEMLLKRWSEVERKRTIKVLEIGCGTGYLTNQLLKQLPNAKVIAVDMAQGMIDVASKRCNHKNVSFVCRDIERTSVKGKYDLIISNATFQWFNYQEQTIQNLYDVLLEDGCLLFSTFGEETFHELHTSQKQTCQKLGLSNHRLGPSFMSLTTLTEQCLMVFGKDPFKLYREETLYQEYFTSVRQFLHSVQRVGANNSTAGRSMQRPSFFKHLFKFYEEAFRTAKGIPATYHALFIGLEKQVAPVSV